MQNKSYELDVGLIILVISDWLGVGYDAWGTSTNGFLHTPANLKNLIDYNGNYSSITIK